MEQGPVAEDEADEAVRAFEALRVEVAAQRRALEQVAAMLGERGRQPDPAAPDYSPTLGTMAQELRAVGTRLDGIEGHPALRLTPAAFGQQVAAGVRQAGDEAGRGLVHAQGRLGDALHELRGLIGSAHGQLAQRRREWIAVAIGVVVGFIVWYPLALLTPWGGGHWLAATLIGGGRWGAGQALMREADPATWERMVRLSKACPPDTATDLCEAAMTARAIPPGPEGARTGSPVPPRPAPRGSRAGQQGQ